MADLRVGILASGNGSNFAAIADAAANETIDAEIAVMVCNRPSAAVIGKAESRNVPVTIIEHRLYAERTAFDIAVADALLARSVSLVALAGFDRLVTGALLERFPDRVINIHPALLPAFPGTAAQNQAADYGVTITGATVHLVDEKVDHGPIIAQAAVAVKTGATADEIRRRILVQEHKLYPFVIRLFAENRIRVEGRKVFVDGGNPTTDVLFSPPLDSD